MDVTYTMAILLIQANLWLLILNFQIFSYLDESTLTGRLRRVDFDDGFYFDDGVYFDGVYVANR